MHEEGPGTNPGPSLPLGAPAGAVETSLDADAQLCFGEPRVTAGGGAAEFLTMESRGVVGGVGVVMVSMARSGVGSCSFAIASST